MRKKVLVFCDFYLPGFKSGGGMWTVVNLVERFAHLYDFYIVTRNYDSVGDTAPYSTVNTDAWNQIGPAQVLYFSPGSLSAKRAASIVGEIKPDLVFLNSALSLPVRQFLIARKRRLFGTVPVILAPCGEMSAGARSVKPLKKIAFFKAARATGLYKGILWKGSFELEAKEIRGVMGGEVHVMVAPDLAPKAILPDFSPEWKPDKHPGSVKLAFISRIVPKKNLKYLLERLCEVNRGGVELDIIGPIEDVRYWAECEEIMSRFPANVSATVAGSYPDQRDALRRLAGSHFFAMPTLNENFGYVFIEALAGGCPLLISDRTVWTDIPAAGVGWRVPLEDPAAYVRALLECVDMDQATFSAMSQRARNYALSWLGRGEVDEANARVFETALRGGIAT